MMKRFAWLALLAGIGCGGGEAGEQVVTGKVMTAGALAVRAVSDDATVAAASVRSDGSFSLALPAGKRYRLEVLTTSGVRHVLSPSAGTLSFEVCQPVDPFDCGGVGDGAGPNSGGGGSMCDPSTGDCEPPKPPDPCQPDASGTVGPNCTPPMPCDPSTDDCDPPKTDPCAPDASGNIDPGCMPPPPPCADPTDPYCACDAAGNCPPTTCDPASGQMCPPPPPPPCADPTDPSSCQDPCMADPSTCGCAMEDPSCWPPPQPPKCDPSGACAPDGDYMSPEHPPGDFGCQDGM